MTDSSSKEKMICIMFSNGKSKKFPFGTLPIEIVHNINKSLANRVLSASIDGKQIELDTPITQDVHLEFYTWEDPMGKKAFWHSSAHLLAQAILKMYPKSLLTIGSPIENGFYYDVDMSVASLKEKDFIKIETIMIENARKCSSFHLYKVSKVEALNFYKKNSYKTELIQNFESSNITFCRHDDFVDLCQEGWHIPGTGCIKYVKILSLSGVYWSGDKNNKQITRIYGISFPNQKELSDYLLRFEESKNRDHRKLGKELGLFTFSERVGSGLPLWQPKGAILRKCLKDFLLRTQKKYGYEMVVTPHIGYKSLYEISGHWDKYGKDSFWSISSPNKDEEFLLKPMNCPHHCEIYRSQQWSYRDLPKRFSEFGTVYRYEQKGELHGLMRVRGFTQDDAHIFCTTDQLLEEFKKVIELVLYSLQSFGFKDYTAQISLRDKKTPNKYIGTDDNWKKSEHAIIQAATDKNLKINISYGEAAFYGPKLDFIVKDALGRSWQLGTIQVDYNLPDRFNLQYRGVDNQWDRPVMIHRASFGSLERFIAILLEHTSGNFPFWLAPIQVMILPISYKHILYAKKVLNLLSEFDIRVNIDIRDEKISKKIIDSEMSKIPFMILVGDKEVTCGNISVRAHKEGNLGAYSKEEFIDLIKSKLV